MTTISASAAAGLLVALLVLATGDSYGDDRTTVTTPETSELPAADPAKHAPPTNALQLER